MTDQRITSTPIDPAKLDRLAEVAVKVGLGLRPGQDLLLTAPAIALPLVRRIAVHAYKAGAGIVTPILSDEEMTLARYRHGHDNSFDRAAGWLYEGMAKAFSDNTARLAIVGDNPMLLSGEDPSKVARASKANSMAYQPALEKIVNFDTNWNIIAYPSPSWAKQVFPNDPEDVAIGKLADAIFAASRVDREDAMANWASHNAVLRERTNWLNGQRFRALQYSGPGTDLTIGLADGHEWEGGASLSKNGISCNANIPTEEVFTTPHCRRVYGHVVSSKPLSYQGTLIDNIAVRFEDGRIVDAKASRGAEVLNKVLDTDEGARRLGEVALVPHSSPISQSGLLFYNTLFDENAASHIALGQCYSKCFVNGAQLTPQQIAAQGGNQSLIHIDWMIGSAETDIDGILADGSKVPVFRKGEWAK
ncbi:MULTISPECIES: aminopeptidase [Bradyrhizobium]|jgi:aminopeptidase|uniref:Aminopeptidase n=1 Tax=Bradyrhizobium diazoefficiens (strain JCM 10833 / BCRC 13528 / IAM 13628 / NBRC 14792 / USDA 110) TaxID=224911 RepID=Q89C57_BRADU|nr:MULTISPECIES: aminopeptidase [Bradyrhizobium]MBP1061645.1 aminopeptidase [Bradyrhizobium japonicum]AND92816.1 peptidase M29 [Bradyrhizobium diazoefficiens USDA 110]AWO94720.1 aminopeptidase [Bradyrhizobium diazoefficiens]MDA9391136.1 peptidase M29 [Bradyrhizobium sp. CCBAU 45394]MDA9540909.1 peptidase M29 [Bradyrhizobium sp. CCBAU 21362]